MASGINAIFQGKDGKLDWYLELKKSAPANDQAEITKRYAEKFQRYMGADA